jgi:hypothetical protein
MNDYDPVGVLGNYLNESITQPNLPRFLLWNGRIKKIADERVLETFFFANKAEKIRKPFAIEDWKIEAFSPSPDIKIGLIPLLRVGSVWNGKGKEIRGFDKGFFQTYEFDITEPQSSSPVKFHTLPEYKSFQTAFSPPAAAAKSFVINYSNVVGVLNLKRGPIPFNFKRIIIPCFEVARFYFFNSTTLTRALLTPGSLDDSNNLLFVPNQNICPVEGSTIIDKPKIVLRIFNEADIPIISRIAFSKEARRVVSLIHRSVLDEKNPGYIESHFPFSLKTTLKVRGIAMQVSGERSFVVTELLSCTGHFPFEELDYTYDQPIIEGSGKGDKPGDWKPGTPKPGKPKMTDKPPTGLSGIFRVTKKNNKRFLRAPKDDQIKYFEPEKKLGEGGDPRQLYDPDEISDGESTKGDGKKRRPKLEVLNEDDKDALEKNRLDRFELFSSILKTLGELHYDTSVIQPYDEAPSSYPVHLDKFRSKTWCYVARETARGIAIARIENNGNYFYLFEHQQRHSEEKIGLRLIWKHPRESKSDQLEESEIEQILLTFASKYGGLGNLKNKYKVKSFRHIQNVNKLYNSIILTINSD